jgi:hypothetical protein
MTSREKSDRVDGSYSHPMANPILAPNPSVLDGLKLLSPTAFEHLVFDLLYGMGLRNLVWRSPGADGGRDIEGNHLTMDFAGTSLLEHWYVECKRYSESLSWPTVREKLAFAENHQAEALLICTTAQLSPQCKEEAARYNIRRGWPRLRFWDAAEMENRVAGAPAIVAKYNLDTREQALAQAVLPLVHESNKVVQSAYALELAGEPSAATELSAAMVELAEVALGAAGSRITVRRFRREFDLYPWVDVLDPCALEEFSSAGLRAMLCAIRYLGERSARVQLARGPHGESSVRATLAPKPGLRRTDSTVIDVIGFWGDIEVGHDDVHQDLRTRK